MRIDMGNFGNAQRTVADTRIDRGNPAEMAEAKINNARTSERLSGMVNQAWDRVGEQMQQLGGEMLQKQRQLAAQKSALQIQDKQIRYQGALQTAQDAIDAGQLKAADIHDFVNKQMADFKPEEIDGLDEAGTLQLQRGMQAVDKQMAGSVDHLYRAAHKVETRTTTDAMIANNERLALNSGADLDKAASLYDSPVFQAQAREAYGADYGKVIAQAKSGIYAAGAKKVLLDNRDSYSGLNSLQKEFEEGGRFAGKMDADTQLSIMGQIDTRKGTLEAQAAAAEARAAAHAQAQAARQMANENRGMAANTQMREFIADGGVPDNAYIERYQQQTANSSFAGDATAVVQLAQQTQQFRALPLAEQERQLSIMAGRSRGNPQDMRVFNALKASHEKEKSALVNDPIAAVTMRTGDQIPALPFDQIQQAKTPEDTKAANQAFAAALYQRAGITAQARQQTQDAPKVLLTQQERQDKKAYADGLGVQGRTDFYKTLANAGGRFGIDLVKEISKSDVIASAAYHAAANPNAQTGALIAQGEAYLQDKKSGFNAPPIGKTQPVIDTALAGAIPAAQRSTLAGSVNAYYVASRAQRGLDPSKIDDDDYNDAITAVVGNVIQYGSGKVVVPANTDANRFRTDLYQTVMQQPNGANSMALIESGQAQLTAIGAKSYMLTQPNGAPYIDPQTNQPVRVSIQ